MERNDKNEKQTMVLIFYQVLLKVVHLCEPI